MDDDAARARLEDVVVDVSMIMTDDEAGLLTHLEWKYPSCDIKLDVVTKAWGANIRLSKTAAHYIVGPSLEQLQIKLLESSHVEGRQAG